MRTLAAVRRAGAMPDLKTGNSVQKFYKQAGVIQSQDGFQVTLDGRGISTPEKKPFSVQSQALALAIAAEWQQQDKFLRPHTMPLMQMTATALDLSTTGLRPTLTDRICHLLQSDSVCFREARPALSQRQEASLRPVLAYLQSQYGISLPTCEGFALPEVPEATFELVRQLCEKKDEYEIVALETAATVAKSAALGLALVDKFLPVKSVLQLARMEEDFQSELSGRVEGTHDLEEAHCLMLLAAARCLTELKSAL